MSRDPDTAASTPAPRVRPSRDGRPVAELIVVGRELLRGEINEGNAARLGALLTERGIELRRVTMIPDDAATIAGAIREAMSRSPHLVITTGGLGPAPDDRTLDAVSEVLGRPLTASPVARDMVEATYQRLYSEKRVRRAGMNLSREKLVRLPVGATPLANPRGVALGCLCHVAGGMSVIALPGLPREALPVLESALDELHPARAGQGVRIRREVEAPTADESELVPMLDRLKEEFPRASITSRPVATGRKNERVIIVVETVAETAPLAQRAAGEVVKRLLSLASGSR